MHCGWGVGVWVLDHRETAGLAVIERAIELNPNSALAWTFLGWLHGLCNRPLRAAEAAQRAMLLSPLDPERWMFSGVIALACLAEGRYVEAVAWSDRALSEQPRGMTVVEVKAAACGHLDRVEEARECIRRLRELLPGWSIANWKSGFGMIVASELRTILVDGLRKAGLPED